MSAHHLTTTRTITEAPTTHNNFPDLMRTGILTLAGTGHVTYVNESFCCITGWDATALYQHSLSRLLRHSLVQSENDKGPYLPASLRAQISAGRRWDGDLNLRRPDDSRYVGAVSITPYMNDESGNVYLIELRDVTTQKEGERMRINFFYDLAHELRTPLTSLSLFHTLLSHNTPPENVEYMAIMKHELDRLEGFIGDLLDFVRLRHGVMPLHQTPIDLNRLIERVLHTQRLHAQQKQLDLRVELSDDLPVIYADNGQVEQVICNLVNNAIKYTPSGKSVGVRTLVARSADNAPCTMLEVWDEGIGIPTDEMPLIFNRFFRASNARDSQIPGTGLGLNIVREILRTHQGDLRLDSTLDVGTRVTVSFPVSKGQ